MTKATKNEQDVDLIVIPDEHGNEEQFEIIMTFDVEERNASYMLVVPAESDGEDEEEVYAFRYEEDGDDITLYTIEDEAEWEIVEETFNTLMAESEDEA